MGHRRISLKYAAEGGCPILDPGDRMVLEGDEVLKRPSGRICARALAAILPRLSEEAADGTEFTCSGPSGCEGRFVLEAASPEDVSGTQRIRRDAVGASEETAFLSRIPVELVKEVVGRSEILRYEETSVVLREGDTGKAVYFVGDGEAEVVKEGESSDVVLATLTRGACFGEMSLLTGEPTSATVRTKGPAAVFALHGPDLEELLSKHPVLAREFSKLLAARLKTTSGSLERELDRGILGRLSMISAVDLIQTLNASRRTGSLSLALGGQECRLCFSQGEVIGAVLGGLEGEEAFFELLSWPDGDFCFEQSESVDEVAGAIERSTTGLLMEGLRRMDEAERQAGAAEEPPADDVSGEADAIMGEALE